MDLRRLELLLQVAMFDSFSKAASVLGIAQPALGRQMQKLEAECGLRIFYRHGRGVSLTPDGQALIDRARPLLQQISAIAPDLQAASKSPHGVVAVGLMPAICNLVGLQLIRTVRAKYRNLRVNIVTGYSGYVLEWLVDGRLDLAVLDDARRTGTIAVEELCQSRLFLVLPNGASVFSIPKKLDESALSEIPLVLPTRNHGLRRTVDLAASALGVKLDIKYEADSMELLKQIVVEGLAATILGMPAIFQEVASKKLVAYPLTSSHFITKLVIANAAGRPFTKAVQIVNSEIKTIMRQLARGKPANYGLLMP